jgi:hypothetical protein
MSVALPRFAPSTIWLPPPPARGARRPNHLQLPGVRPSAVPGFPVGVSTCRYIFLSRMDDRVIMDRNHPIGRCASHLPQFSPVSTLWHPQNLMMEPQCNRIWHTNIRGCAPQNRQTALLFYPLCIKISFTAGRHDLCQSRFSGLHGATTNNWVPTRTE